LPAEHLITAARGTREANMSDLTPRKPHDSDDEPTAPMNAAAGATPEKPEPAPVSAVAGSTPGTAKPAAPQQEPGPTAAQQEPEQAAPQQNAEHEPVASQAAPVASQAAPVTGAPAAPVTAGPAGERWHRRRVPVLAAIGALLLGGVIGGGAVAIGAFAVGEDRGDDRGQHGPRFGRDGGDRAEGRGGDRFERRGEARRDGRDERRRARDGSAPVPSGSAVPASPAPSASS
jgi:hypothetical protein